jgi:NitT/TauT family transport system substrate-binding protein
MYDLPLIVAEEKGLWKEKGVNVEWLSFKGSSAMYRAMAAKSVDMSISMGASAIQAASRGVRVVIVADLGAQLDFEVWVKGDGPIKKPADLKGDKIGIGRRGGSSFALARFILNALKMEKDVQLVSVGAPQPSWPR